MAKATHTRLVRKGWDQGLVMDHQCGSAAVCPVLGDWVVGGKKKKKKKAVFVLVGFPVWEEMDPQKRPL